MLTLSKVVVEVGSRADAARAGDYRLEPDAAPAAFARADYQLEVEQAKRAVQRPGSSLWLGRRMLWRGSGCGVVRRSSVSS